MGREWAAAAGIGTSPKGGQLGRDLTQEEADKLGARMLTDIGDRVQWAAAMSGPSFLNRGEPIPMSETIREVDPEDFPEPPMSPGTASDRAAALTMPDEEARALLAENGMNAAQPDPKKAVREADPAFLGTLAYLSSLYPQASRYAPEVTFVSSDTLPNSPVENGQRSGKVSGQIRRSARAANWGAQVRWTTDWNDPNGDFDSNFRGKLIYNDYRGDDADYLRQMDDGTIITLPRSDGSKLRLQHYRWESGLAEAIGIPAEGWVEEGQTPQAARRVPYGIRTSKEVQDIWRTENAHTISDTYPDATPNNEAAQAAHEFGHAIAGGLRSPEFTALLTEANDNLKENPRTADAIPLAAYVDKYLASASEAGTDAPLAWLWTLTDRIARQTKTGDLGWRVFIDRGISMGEIRSVSPYAATEPAEALAELFSAHYLGLLDDELDAKFEAMLAELTQTDLPEPPMSPGTAPAPAEMMAAVKEVGVEVEAPGLSPFDRYDIGTLFPDLRHSTFQTQPEETIAYYRDMAPAVAAMNEQYPDVMESLTSVAWLSSRDVGWSSEWAELATQAFPDEPVSNLRRWGNEEIRRNLSKARASFTYAGRAQQLGRQASGKIILNDLTIDYQKPPGEHLAPATKTAYGTFLHEFGHAVAHKYNFQERLSLAGAFGFANEDDYFDWDAWYQEGGEWLGWDLLAEYFDISAVMEVSAYAASNPNEAFAEMFAMYYHPDFDLPPALKANFEDFLAAMRRGDRRTNSGPVEPQSQDVLRARFEQEVQLSIARDEAGLDPSDFGDFGPYLDSEEQSG